MLRKIRRRLEQARKHGVPNWGMTFKQMTMGDKQDWVRAILSYRGLHLSHSADYHTEQDVICACEREKIKLMYKPFYATHWVYNRKDCRIGNWCYCVNHDTLEMVRHRIGDCHLSKYSYIERSEYETI